MKDTRKAHDTFSAFLELTVIGKATHVHICAPHRLLLKVYYVPSTVVLDARDNIQR